MVDLERAIEARRIIVFNLAKGMLGEQESSAFGRLIMAMLLGIALRRQTTPKHLRTPTHVFVDECHNFVAMNMEHVLLEARKFGLYMTLAQQNVGHNMSTQLTNAVTGATRSKIAGVVEPDRRATAARLFPVDQGQFGELRTGQFFIRAESNPVIKLYGRSDLIGTSRKMTKPSWRRLVRRQLDRYYRDVSVDDTPKHVPSTSEPPPRAPESDSGDDAVPEHYRLE